MGAALLSTRQRRAERGFGLLEVVLSAGILATVIGAAVGLMNASLRRSTLASQRATAMNLAQEGVELVRVARDTTYVDRISNPWTAFLPPVTDTSSFALVFRPGETGGCCVWTMQKTSAQSALPETVITDGVESITLDGTVYTREVFVTVPAAYSRQSGLDSSVASEDIVRQVRVVVRWGSGPSEQVTSQILLTDWRQGA